MIKYNDPPKIWQVNKWLQIANRKACAILPCHDFKSVVGKRGLSKVDHAARLVSQFPLMTLI